jgi:hypothetical protein
MSVDEVYAGDVPAVVVSEGWSAGCAALRGDQLRVGDRVVITTSLLPRGPDDLRWRGHSLVWRATPDGWRLYRWALSVSTRFSSLPNDAKGDLTIAELAAFVSAPEDELPPTDAASAGSPPGRPVRGTPPTVGPTPDDPDAPIPDFVPVWHRDREEIAGYVASRDLALQGAFPWWYQQPPAPVYAEDLWTLVGFLFDGKGFVPLGVDPRSVPDLELGVDHLASPTP